MIFKTIVSVLVLWSYFITERSCSIHIMKEAIIGAFVGAMLGVIFQTIWFSFLEAWFIFDFMNRNNKKDGYIIGDITEEDLKELNKYAEIGKSKIGNKIYTSFELKEITDLNYECVMYIVENIACSKPIYFTSKLRKRIK